MIDTSVRTYLLAQAAVTAIVGTRGVYVGAADQKTPLPYCVVQQVSGKPEQHANGVSGLSRGTVEVRCYDKSDAKAGTLGSAVSAALAAKQAAMGDSDVRACIVLDENRDDGLPRQGDQAGNPCVVVTAEVFFK